MLRAGTRSDEEMKSFYTLNNGLPEKTRCSGTACFVAGNSMGISLQDQGRGHRRIYCLGKCFTAPASSEDNNIPRIANFSRKSVLVEPLMGHIYESLDRYMQETGMSALKAALSMSRDSVISEVEKSGLRGRGGAGFPTGLKWRSVANEKAKAKYVVMNGDEGDPGSYIDRFLMEYNPYALIESMIICGYAVGASTGYAYIRAEYPEAIKKFLNAAREMESAGFLGREIMGSGFQFNLSVVQGKGSYICGEETALMRSIEGMRPEVSIRPPYPTEKGLFGNPTVINNVETLANIPWIIRNGHEAYGELGYGKSRGTKLLSLNSLFVNPGIYEVEFGTPLDTIFYDIGGGMKNGSIKGVMLGGPLSGIMVPDEFRTKLDYEEIRKAGASLGHGGIIAFNESTGICDLIEHVATFAADESCGKCTPCRLGTAELSRMFRRESGESPDYIRFERDIESLAAGSLCGLGTGMAEFARSARMKFSEEVKSCFT
ncbi:MAG: NADH-ubiquinone oxidoreductase-F iron-sulfur binding region domain-containing protein [Thermoplasmataceae archaeon]